jgi:hypothetical protein
MVSLYGGEISKVHECFVFGLALPSGLRQYWRPLRYPGNGMVGSARCTYSGRMYT